MDIPENRQSSEDDARIDRVSAIVLEKLRDSDEAWLVWTDYPSWLARAVADRFLAKGYHAKSSSHMRGDGPSWFWYGVCIGKHAFVVDDPRKVHTTVLG